MVGSALPVLYTVPGLARVAVPASALVGGVLVPGQVGPIEFQFPTAREVTGLLVIPTLGTAAALAELSLEIVDEDNKQIFSDQIGDERAPRQPFAVPCLSMAGSGFRPFPMQLIVAGGDRWRLTVKNIGAFPTLVASVSIHHRRIRT